MKNIGKVIRERRIRKGFTQEELAELSKVNLRTIQRTEKGKTVPHDTTLAMICDVLEINMRDLKSEVQFKIQKSAGSTIVNFIYLILVNLLFMLSIGFMTLDSNANLNSRIGGILLSFMIPFFIVSFTQKMGEMERLLKFGSGFFVYAIALIVVHGFPQGFYAGTSTGLFLCILIWVTVLFYGDRILKAFKNNK